MDRRSVWTLLLLCLLPLSMRLELPGPRDDGGTVASAACGGCCGDTAAASCCCANDGGEQPAEDDPCGCEASPSPPAPPPSSRTTVERLGASVIVRAPEAAAGEAVFEPDPRPIAHDGRPPPGHVRGAARHVRLCRFLI